MQGIPLGSVNELGMRRGERVYDNQRESPFGTVAKSPQKHSPCNLGSGALTVYPANAERASNSYGAWINKHSTLEYSSTRG